MKSSLVSACQSASVAWLLVPVLLLGANARQDPVPVSLPLNLGCEKRNRGSLELQNRESLWLTLGTLTPACVMLTRQTGHHRWQAWHRFMRLQ